MQRRTPFAAWAGSIAALVAALMLACGSPRAERSPLWCGLERGPHAAGFTTVERYDHSRPARCKTGPDGEVRGGERARAVQVCIWYPAVAAADRSAVVFGEYLFPNPSDLGFFERIAALQAREIYDRVIPALGNDRQVMLELFNTKLEAVRDAPPADGSFPLVLYFPRASGGIAENAVMCEYLASHGLIVAATHSTGASLLFAETDGRDLEAAVRDGGFIIASLIDWPHRDRDRLGVIGCGLGGAAGLLLRMENTDVDAVVALDDASAPHEYAALIRANHRYDPARMPVPLLEVCRGEPAPIDSAMLHELRYAERALLTVPGPSDRPVTGYDVVSTMAVDTTAPPPEARRLAYETVCRSVKRFLRAELCGDGEASELITRSPAEAGVPVDVAGLTVMAAEQPPICEERFIEVIVEEGAERARELLDEQRRAGREPVVREESINRLGILYARMQRVEAGAEILRLNTEIHPNSASAWLSLAYTYLYTGRADLAGESFRKVLEVLADDGALSEEEREAVRTAAERGLERLERQSE